MRKLNADDISYTIGCRPIWAVQNNRGNAGADLTNKEIDQYWIEFFELSGVDLKKGKQHPFSKWNREAIEKLKK